LHRPPHHPPPHSFPTRRSSDLETVTLTRLAAATLDVERKASWPVAANLRFRKLGEQLANRREQARVRRRVRPWRASDRRLVDVEDRKSTRLNSSHDQISYAVFC